MSKEATLNKQSRFGEIAAVQGRRLAWIAERLEVDPSAVSRWASGEWPIPPARVPQLAELLGVEESDLIETEAVA